MNKEIEEKIISEYQKGNGSIIISKMTGVPKHTILAILHKHNLVRQRDRCKSLDIVKEGERFYVTRLCPMCNEEIKTYSKQSTIACRNHFNKLRDNSTCKKCMGECNLGEGNPFYGKTHKESTIRQISESRKNKYTGYNNHMKQEKYRQMSRDIARSNWDNNIWDRDTMSELMKQNQRKGKLNSGITSKKEKEIIELLTEMGIYAIQSYRVDSKICDIFIPSLNLIIEYFGDYWHCNPIKYSKDYYNVKKNKYAWELWDYDKKKLDLVKSYGYNLEVIWENELKSNNDKLILIINKYATNNNSAPEWS